MNHRQLPITSLLLCLALFGCAIPASTTDPVADKSSVTAEVSGFDNQRLARLDAAFEGYVARGELPGVVMLVLKDGAVAHQGVYGWQDLESRTPMTEDSLFRIASQTKALVSVGIMMLQEEGRLLIGDPLDRYLPEWASTSVAVPKDAGGYEVVPAKRPITLRDLLTHTAGIGYGDGPAADAWAAAGIQGWYFAGRNEPIRETVRRMAVLPQDSQPGEAYVYGYATDILGAVIEVVSGQSLDSFLHERLIGPLGMSDSHFYLPPEKSARLATVYGYPPEQNRLVRAPDTSDMTGQGDYVRGPRCSFSGGAGLVSSAHDYARFLSMLLNGGELDGRRYLSRKTVDLMTSNHLGQVVFPWQPGTGFGLGFSVALDTGERGVPGSVGEYGWGGAYHSHYWVDPAERLVVVYFTQVIPAGNLDDHGKLRALLYQALE